MSPRFQQSSVLRHQSIIQMVQLNVRNHLTNVGDDDLPIVVVGALLFQLMMVPLLISAPVTYYTHCAIAEMMLILPVVAVCD